ncbi:MAG: hypothetical protein HY318_12835 [Armatimonadetes bacterium]|nr:hypothetical protein [Armatimonadota bacterium]
MSTDNGELPPQILELLKKRGWTWPPDEEFQKRRDEAWKQLAGSMRMEPEVRREVVKSFPGRFPDSDEAD